MGYFSVIVFVPLNIVLLLSATRSCFSFISFIPTNTFSTAAVYKKAPSDMVTTISPSSLQLQSHSRLNAKNFFNIDIDSSSSSTAAAAVPSDTQTKSSNFLPTTNPNPNDLSIQDLCAIKWLLHFKSAASVEKDSPSNFFTRFSDNFNLYTNGLGSMVWKVAIY